MLLLSIALASVVGIIMGLLGGGGSILTLPILHYALGLTGRNAIATSLILVGVTSAVGAALHARAGRLDLPMGLVFGAASMLGAYGAGHWLSPLLPGSLLLILFALLMVLAAASMLRKPPTASSPLSLPLPQAAKPKLTSLAVRGLATGVATGLVGAGGGFVVVPALVLFGGLSMPTAVGTSLLIIAMNSVAAFAGHVSHVTIDWPITGGIVIAAVLGAFVGAAASPRVAPERLRVGFAWFVVSIAIFVLLQELPPYLNLSLGLGWAIAGSLGGAALAAAWHRRPRPVAVLPSAPNARTSLPR